MPGLALNVPDLPLPQVKSKPNDDVVTNTLIGNIEPQQQVNEPTLYCCTVVCTSLMVVYRIYVLCFSFYVCICSTHSLFIGDSFWGMETRGTK